MHNNEQHLPVKTVIHPDYASATSFIKQVPSLFLKEEGELLHNGRNKVRRFTHNGEVYVAKKFKKPNIIQRIAYSFFRRSKAERAYLYAGELSRRGIDTPHEVAYIEEHSCGLFKTGYFISLNCNDPQAFPQLNEAEQFDRKLAQALAQFVAFMHRKGVLFGDLNLRNFLYHQKGHGYHFCMVDTNRSHFCEGKPEREACLYNLRTLTHRRDLFQFIITEYARARHWDETETVTGALEQLTAFENRLARKRKFQKKVNIRK